MVSSTASCSSRVNPRLPPPPSRGRRRKGIGPAARFAVIDVSWAQVVVLAMLVLLQYLLLESSAEVEVLSSSVDPPAGNGRGRGGRAKGYVDLGQQQEKQRYKQPLPGDETEGTPRQGRGRCSCRRGIGSHLHVPPPRFPFPPRSLLPRATRWRGTQNGACVYINDIKGRRWPVMLQCLR